MKLGQCRLRIVNYFDDLISDVDLKAEQALANECTECMEDTEMEMEQVRLKREELISRIRQMQDYNLAHLNKTYKEEEFERLGETEIDTRLFQKFCFMIDALQSDEDDDCFVDETFGHFVVVDRFIREDTLAAFKELFHDGWSMKKKLSFETEGSTSICVESDVFKANNLMIEITTEELFRLSLVRINDTIIKAIKEPARVLFENIQRVEFDIPALSHDYIESVRMIGRNADHVHLKCAIDDFEPSVIASLSDIRIKSLWLVDGSFSLTRRRSTLTEPLKLTDLLLPFVHLEELALLNNREGLRIEHKIIKNDRLKKLVVVGIEVDVKFIECFESLNELVLERVPKTAKAIMKKQTLLSQIKSVEITAGSLREIKPESFKGLQSIISLKLRSSDVEKIHKNAFLHLNNLSRLDLSDNNIEKLQSGALDGLTSLTSLNLSHCILISLDENVFKDLRSLTKLNLSNNMLKTIGQSISCLSQLKELSLRHNSIETIDGQVFEQLVELETLDLSQNKIKSIEPSVFHRLAKLKELSLKSNRVSSIEAGAFYGLSALKSLNLSRNRISSIEPTAFSPLVASLEHLDLERNQINRDTASANMTTQEQLLLSNSDITII